MKAATAFSCCSWWFIRAGGVNFSFVFVLANNWKSIEFSSFLVDNTGCLVCNGCSMCCFCLTLPWNYTGHSLSDIWGGFWGILDPIFQCLRILLKKCNITFTLYLFIILNRVPQKANLKHLFFCSLIENSFALSLCNMRLVTKCSWILTLLYVLLENIFLMSLVFIKASSPQISSVQS